MRVKQKIGGIEKDSSNWKRALQNFLAVFRAPLQRAQRLAIRVASPAIKRALAVAERGGEVVGGEYVIMLILTGIGWLTVNPSWPPPSGPFRERDCEGIGRVMRPPLGGALTGESLGPAGPGRKGARSLYFLLASAFLRAWPGASSAIFLTFFGKHEANRLPHKLTTTERLPRPLSLLRCCSSSGVICRSSLEMPGQRFVQYISDSCNLTSLLRPHSESSAPFFMET